MGNAIFVAVGCSISCMMNRGHGVMCSVSVGGLLFLFSSFLSLLDGFLNEWTGNG